MQIGANFPTTEIGNDVGAIREFAQVAEQLGYSFMSGTDHVLGIDRTSFEGLRRNYTVRTPFHEVFVVFSYLAAVTTRLVFAPSVIVLPQRQTALVAKQAAALDVLSGGRLRVGVGIGWDPVEFQALGENFTNRARRMEEQIEVLRRLWTDPVVDFKGKYHLIDKAGINPLPLQRPIPLWVAGVADVALPRVARLGDGWCSQVEPNDNGAATIERMRGHLRDAGRANVPFPIEVSVAVTKGTPDDWAATAARFAAIGITHLKVQTLGAGWSADRHIATLRRFRETVSDADWLPSLAAPR